MTTPQTLTALDLTLAWPSQSKEFRWRYSSTGYEHYDVWDGAASPPGWWSATQSMQGIKVDTATDTWMDDGPYDPQNLSESSGVVTVLGGYQGTTNVYTFTKPTNASWHSTGPTVTSITDDTIFVPSDTVSNTDFTLLKNGSAYANTNISLTGPGAQPPSDARGYTYSLISTTTHDTGNYNFTIDSKSITNFHYDDSWTSSPSSGRSTNSTRILNVIASIPATTYISGSGAGAANTTHFPSGRRIRYVTPIYVNSVHTENFFLDFAVSQKIINGTSEIVGTFYEVREDANGDNATFSQSSDFIIGDNAEMTWTRSLLGDTIVYTVTDWVYANEPEGDGYVAPVTTTSNGGGKPDRYPLIMTNLFNRNRSLYSIGMTHKDTWDLFL